MTEPTDTAPWDAVASEWADRVGRALRGDAAALADFLASVVVVQGRPVIALGELLPADADRAGRVVADFVSEEFRNDVLSDLALVVAHLQEHPGTWRTRIGDLPVALAARTELEVATEAGPGEQDRYGALRYVVLVAGGDEPVVLLSVGHDDGVEWVGRAALPDEGLERRTAVRLDRLVTTMLTPTVSHPGVAGDNDLMDDSDGDLGLGAEA